MSYPAVRRQPISSDPSYLKRFDTLETLFVAKYNRKPDFYARAPGRVNIIGEHIDYMGYAVLPMAVQQDILIACGKNDSNTLNIANSDGAKFPEFHANVSDCEIEKGGAWHNYFLCGFRGIVEQLGLTSPVGMDVIIDGDVPMAAGLSSSSALVCCSGLATMHGNGGQLTKVEIADVCTWCERYIGTEGGGMDQSISFLAEAGQVCVSSFLTRLDNDGKCHRVSDCLNSIFREIRTEKKKEKQIIATPHILMNASLALYIDFAISDRTSM
ncbi:N-acetylgalactosamine kinase-like [Corticium candelabrum]|uniref:N-acetylgalactosamine kinase-like n=1 Tax=Corticium candelabrum TaxID=121492 RepID=UPI002E26899B|nr:N-acetylgalactosamine kinase-like [Corticium candelabrum]